MNRPSSSPCRCGRCGRVMGAGSAPSDREPLESEFRRFARARGGGAAKRPAQMPVRRSRGRPAGFPAARAPSALGRRVPWVFGPWRRRPWIFTAPAAITPEPVPVVAEPDAKEPDADATDPNATSAADAASLAQDPGGDGAEAEVLAWRPVEIQRHPAVLPAGGGVYVVERVGRPLFVGEAQDFGAEWRRRSSTLYELGIIDAGRLAAPFPVRIWFGLMSPRQLGRRQRVAEALSYALKAAGLGASLRQQGAAEAAMLRPFVVRRLLPPLWLRRARRVPHLRGNTLVIERCASELHTQRASA